MAVRVSIVVVLLAEDVKYANAWRDRGQPHPTPNICVLLGRHKVRENGRQVVFSYAPDAEFGPSDAKALRDILVDSKSFEVRRACDRIKEWLDQSIVDVIGSLDEEDQPVKEHENHFIGKVSTSARRFIMLAKNPLGVATARFQPAWWQKGGRWAPATPDGQPIRPILFTRATAIAHAERFQEENRADFYFIVAMAGFAYEDQIVWPTPGIVSEIGRL